ncbi:hypothetical protein CNMCM5793_006460 [Aspergillus hiratsukae]|uniref:Uncharacterized protein n=1 Tax=Aspergillus hiratsukae TaxID=1194566 RepID=A0A8H6UBF3_9EURO|nr:hypothetical protein CNMCM5793_006460 [Aspergillus hiratsukae]KAF7160229.1 hypothetical protein CNMCM6106_007665 [Aspergillus hiratsukae]
MLVLIHHLKHTVTAAEPPDFLSNNINNQLDLVKLPSHSKLASSTKMLSIQQRLVFAQFTPVASHQLPVFLPSTMPVTIPDHLPSKQRVSGPLGYSRPFDTIMQ